jgi:succinate-acetate transporter protein
VRFRTGLPQPAAGSDGGNIGRRLTSHPCLALAVFATATCVVALVENVVAGMVVAAVVVGVAMFFGLHSLLGLPTRRATRPS